MRKEVSPQVLIGIVAAVLVLGVILFFALRKPDLTTPANVGLGKPAKAGELPPGYKAPGSPANAMPGPDAQGSLGAVGH